MGFAQEEDTTSSTKEHLEHSKNHEHEENEEETKYLIAFSMGVTHIPSAFTDGKENAIFVPTIGIDFFYEIKRRLSIGLVGDLELSNYIVDFKREDLKRDKAVIFTVMAAYEIKPKWKILMGSGIEFERHKNLFVLRAGTGYEFPMANNWNIEPTFFYDFKEDFDTWALAIGLNKRF